MVVLVCFLLPLQRPQPKATWGRKERVHLADLSYTSWSQSIRQGPGDRNWSWSHGGMLLTDKLPMACSPCFLLPLRTTLPRGGITHSGMWAFLHQEALIEKMPHGLTQMPVWWRHFLSCGFSLPTLSQSCQADKNPAKFSWPSDNS